MDLAAAAERSGMSAGTLRRWIASGRLLAVKESNRYYVTPGDLDAAMKAPAEAARQEFDAAAKRAVQGWPPFSAERRAELARVLGTVNARPPASAAEQPGEEVGAGSTVGSTDAEVKEWARREAAKAPPFRPEQLDLIISAFANALRDIPDQDDEPGGVTGE